MRATCQKSGTLLLTGSRLRELGFPPEYPSDGGVSGPDATRRRGTCLHVGRLKLEENFQKSYRCLTNDCLLECLLAGGSRDSHCSVL